MIRKQKIINTYREYAKKLNELQLLFATTALDTSFYLPYFLPYTIRKLKETGKKIRKFTRSEEIGAYSGFALGNALNIAQCIIYYRYGIERQNYEVFAIPLITNLGSTIYESRRSKNLESRINKNK